MNAVDPDCINLTLIRGKAPLGIHGNDAGYNRYFNIA
jgi:hypothetical protein